MNRIGVVAIIIEEEKESVQAVNRILSEFSDCIRGRMGIPDKASKTNVISVIVEITTQQMGALTGKLGNLKGVMVKSLMTDKTTD